jgi:hypothetical protein
LPNNHLAYFFLLRIKIRSNPSGADGLGDTEGEMLGETEGLRDEEIEAEIEAETGAGTAIDPKPVRATR